MKRALFVVVVVILLGAGALIAGASAKSLIDEGAQEGPTTSEATDSGGSGSEGSELEPINPEGSETSVESDSDKAARQLDMVVIALVVLALLVAVATVVIWRRSRPDDPVGSEPGATRSADPVNSQGPPAG